MDRFTLHHWEFFKDDDMINVYEVRDGDVIGGLDEWFDDIEGLFEEIKDKSEDELYWWINNNIEYF